MKIRKLCQFLFFFFIVVLFACDKREYDSFQWLSSDCKRYIPFMPGDTLTFVDSNENRVSFVSNTRQNTFFFEHTVDHYCDMCGSDDVTREIYKCYCESTSKKAIIYSEIYVSENYDGDDFEILRLTFNNNGNERIVEMIARDFNSWLEKYKDLQVDYTHRKVPFIHFHYFSKLKIADKEFDHVFTDEQSDHGFYYSQQKGILALNINGKIYVNEKYR